MDENHTDENVLPPEFECTVCGDIFETVKQLRNHVRTEHGGEGPAQYKCAICGDIFNAPPQLRRHIHNYHGLLG